MDEMQQPNVLLICADMIGAHNLGCYGNAARVTPHIDGFAENGTVFEQAYCASSPCIPARASMMTGQYARTHGKMAHIKMTLQPQPPLLPEILAGHGYRTGLVGKTHWWPSADTLGCEEAYITIDNHLTAELGNNDAYIRFLRERNVYDYQEGTWDKRHLAPDNLPEDCLKVNWTGDQAGSLLTEFAKDEQPFFLFCSFVEPHGWGSVTRDYLEEFRGKAIPPIIGYGAEESNKPEIFRRAAAKWTAGKSKEEMEEYRLGVYASLSLVDQNIGKLLATLDRTGRMENTIIVFLTDHGDFMYDHGLLEKTFLYESAIHIPFIMAGPGIPRGERREHLVSQIDLLPTVLDFCGIAEDDLVIEGRSVVPVIDNPKAPWRKNLFCELDQTIHLHDLVSASAAKMLRAGPWKYIYTLTDGHEMEQELYNLEDDPRELRNLARDPDQQDRIMEYRQEILRWLVATEVSRLHPAPENHYHVPHIEREYF
jgi:arylsulfatase A-like enzyme